jgi:hypothetical protein
MMLVPCEGSKAYSPSPRNIIPIKELIIIPTTSHAGFAGELAVDDGVGAIGCAAGTEND